MKTALSVTLIVTLIPVCAAFARTWDIYSNGSGDAPTIQAGIDSASAGDTLELYNGTYYEHDIQIKSGVAIDHFYGTPAQCIIDAGGQGRVMVFDGVDATTSVVDVTLTGGHASGTGGDGCGGGMLITNYGQPEFHMCIVEGNTADNLGGGAYCEDNASPQFSYCTFRDNQAGAGGGGLACASNSTPAFDAGLFWRNRTDGNGGGVHCSGSAVPNFRFCTFLNCVAAGYGGCMYSATGSSPIVDFCSLVFSVDGEGAYAADDPSIPDFGCCDIYGNEGGDWVGRIADQYAISGNFSLDPLFCDTSAVGSETPVEDCSPCLYHHQPFGDCASQTGLPYAGCGCGEATEPSTWGTIKSLYR